MAQNCYQCQAPLSEKAKFCPQCGADQAKAPEKAPGIVKLMKTCASCKTEIPVRAKFCPSCGVASGAVRGAVATAEATPEPAPKLKQAPAPKKISSQVSAKKKRAPVASSPKVRKKHPVLIVLAFVLALVLAGRAVFESSWFDRLLGPGKDSWRSDESSYTVGEDVGEELGEWGADEGIVETGAVDISYTEADYQAAEQVSGDVSPEQSAIQFGPIGLDFGVTNLTETCTVDVKTLAPKTDSRLGLTAQLYDFTLTGSAGEISEFPTTVEVTLPCDVAEDEIAFLQYYREADQTWQMLPSTRDPEAGTISCRMSHFSGIGVFKSDGSVLQSIPGSAFSYVGEYRGQTTPVMLTSGDLDKLLASISPDQMGKILQGAKIPADDEIAGALAFFNNSASASDLAIGTDRATTYLKQTLSPAMLQKAGPVLTGIGAALVMGRICYQLNKGVNPATIVTDNAFNIVESSLGLAALYTGAPPLAFAATAVFASGLIYDNVIKSDAPAEWDEYTYYYFNRHSVRFDTDTLVVGAPYYDKPTELILDAGGQNTVKAIDAIYKKYGKEPVKLDKALKIFIDDYSQRFWIDPDFGGPSGYYHSVLQSLGTLRTLNAPERYPMPSEAKIEVFKANFRRELLGELQPVLKEYMEKTYNDLKQGILDDVQKKYLPMLNTVLTFELIDPTPGVKTFDQSKYAQAADYAIMFGDPTAKMFNAGGLDYAKPADHLFKAQVGSNKAYQCSIYAWMAQGLPKTIDISGLQDNSLVTVPFVLDLPITRITLGESKVSAKALQLRSLNPYGVEQMHEEIIEKALQDAGRIPLQLAEDGTFKLSSSTSYTENQGDRSDPDDYTLETKTRQLNVLQLEGQFKDGGTCKLNAEIHFISQSDDVERSSGDFWSVEEHRISDLEQLITLTGTGVVEMTTVTLDNGSTQPGVRLYFDVDIKGTSHYKYTYKAITGNPEANINEVQKDQTDPVENQDSFYLEFLIP